jgi:K+-sensing histidine kinase KdpD
MEDVRRDLPLFGEHDFRLEALGGTLKADPDRLTQVLRHLVRNAVAHTEPGDRIVLAARPGDGRLDITVSDSDSGRATPQRRRERSFWGLAHRRRNGSTVGSGLVLRPDFPAQAGMPPTARPAPRGGRHWVTGSDCGAGAGPWRYAPPKWPRRDLVTARGL